MKILFRALINPANHVIAILVCFELTCLGSKAWHSSWVTDMKVHTAKSLRFKLVIQTAQSSYQVGQTSQHGKHSILKYARKSTSEFTETNRGGKQRYEIWLVTTKLRKIKRSFGSNTAHINANAWETYYADARKTKIRKTWFCIEENRKLCSFGQVTMSDNNTRLWFVGKSRIRWSKIHCWHAVLTVDLG